VSGSVIGTTLIRWTRIGIVAAHGRVVAVRVLRAIPGRVVPWVSVTETVTEVEAKESAADAEYGAAVESSKLPLPFVATMQPSARCRERRHDLILGRTPQYGVQPTE
jgi:hypothetical protein